MRFLLVLFVLSAPPAAVLTAPLVPERAPSDGRTCGEEERRRLLEENRAGAHPGTEASTSIGSNPIRAKGQISRGDAENCERERTRNRNLRLDFSRFLSACAA